jgi:hypothetical protein
MMQGCVSAPVEPHPERPLRYRVERREGGWSVVINGCATRPMADRARAEALVRSLQAEADGLRHQTPRRLS